MTLKQVLYILVELFLELFYFLIIYDYIDSLDIYINELD